jgi:hypothetical protein
MSIRRVLALTLSILAALPLLLSQPVKAQSVDRIWGRITTVSGEKHEGFIRWDRNEGSWADQLDGSKEHLEFEFQDWWRLAHPGDRQRDRVVELAGYRISWDDEEPTFPSSAESGVRFGHIKRITIEDNEANLELRSGKTVTLSGGATDLGSDLREVLVMDGRGRTVELEWEDLAAVDFMSAPAGAQARAARIHGTVEMKEGPGFTGYIAWDVNHALGSDNLEGEDEDGGDREIPFRTIATIHPGEDRSLVTLTGGDSFRLSGTDDVTDGNDGMQISDPDLGFVEVDWDDVERVRFHAPEPPVGWGAFDGGVPLRGTVVTTDSTELVGWIKWDGDETYSWELLDGRQDDVSLDIEFAKIAEIEKVLDELTSVNLGPAGLSVRHPEGEQTQVTLRDGRTFIMEGSNDVDEGNDGIYVLLENGGLSPEDEGAEWIMVRWEDFLSARFDWGDER